MSHESGIAGLGLAAPSAQRLRSIVASALNVTGAAAQDVRVESASVQRLELPALNMTTGGLWRVHGDARIHGAHLPFSIVVKVLQSPLLWENISVVPEQLRGELVTHYPWRREALVYGSALASALPDGVRLPDVWDIVELDGDRVALWLEDVFHVAPERWSADDFAHAARYLGCFAGSAAVRDLESGWDRAMDAERLRYYLAGVGQHVYIPALLGEELWAHPAVAASVSPSVKAGLRWLARNAEDMVEELLTLPRFPSHGDACPQNLLMSGHGRSDHKSAPNFTFIDWGLSGWNCAGFDLGQLLAGRVHAGTLDGRSLRELEQPCFTAYCEGLAAAGVSVDDTVVRRGHALSMAIFAGLNAAITDRLQEADAPELRGYVASRLAMADFVVELVQSTEP